MTGDAAAVVIGAGAAGLMAAVFAARTHPGRRVVVVDGARSLGAKILVSGGARCNVTHHTVTERDFSGSSPAAIRRVLRRFDVPHTVAFFRELGVELKREDTGKLFPVSNRSRTVLDALLHAAREAGVGLVHPWRVATVARMDDGFRLTSTDGAVLVTPRVVLATGGRSLPKSGSDGHGYVLARALGHTISEPVVPALVPLVLSSDHPVRSLSGLTLRTRVEVRAPSGARLASFTDSTLCPHFGLSGPSVLDASRHWLVARHADRGVRLVISWLPDVPAEQLDGELRDLRAGSVGAFLSRRLPDRLAQAVCHLAGVDPATPGHRLDRDARRALVRELTEAPMPVAGDRGWNEAEVTAGGVPLAELHLHTLASRRCPGLHLCGEIVDVDGRIGGFNFQWAWASGYVVGTSLLDQDSVPEPTHRTQ